MNQKAGFLAPLSHRLKKILAIPAAEEEFFAAIATAYDVVNGPVIFNARWAYHGASATSMVANVKHITPLYYGLSLLSGSQRSPSPTLHSLPGNRQRGTEVHRGPQTVVCESVVL